MVRLFSSLVDKVIAKRKKEAADIQAHIVGLLQEKELLANAIRSQKLDVSATEKEHERLKQEIIHLREFIGRKIAEKTELEQKIRKAAQRAKEYDAMKSAMDSREAQILSREKSLELSRRAVGRKDKRIASLEKEITRGNAEFARVRCILQETRQQLERIRPAKTRYIATNPGLGSVRLMLVASWSKTKNVASDMGSKIIGFLKF